MRVLVIPDVHLRSWMFEEATKIMREDMADNAVCLMDIADDWNKQWQLELYEQAYDAAIDFADEFRNSLWCYGNHDISYEWQYKETGYSPIAAYTVCSKLHTLREILPHRSQIGFIQRIDNVLFSHGGILQSYVDEYVPQNREVSVDTVIRKINRLKPHELWRDDSPLWYRPQYGGKKYGKGRYFQVAGHTPMEKVHENGGIIYCDVFSTHRNGAPIGEPTFPIIDSITGKYELVRV